MTTKKMAVAVVENDIGVSKALTRLICAYGFEVQTFSSAECYLQQYNPAVVDCLVLDIDLDGMSGLELQQILIANGNAPPVIFITGQASEPTARQAADLGCIAFLHKPFESHFLRSALELALHRPAN